MEDFKKELDICLAKLNKEIELGWDEIVEELGLDIHYDTLRRMAYGYKKYNDFIKEQSLSEDTPQDKINEYKETLLELKKTRQMLSDERTFTNKKIRALARVEDFISLLKDELELLSLSKPLVIEKDINHDTGEKEGILLLSDIHYGININNTLNFYNPEECRKRMSRLIDNVLRQCEFYGIKKLNVFELGDTISGNIHNNLRLENRIGASKQVIGVAELISQALCLLAEKLDSVVFTMVEGNHDRLLPNKDDNLNEDSFNILVQELIIQRCKNISNVKIIKSSCETYTQLNICGYNCVGVHGDKDKPQSVVENITAITGEVPDYVFIGHFHNANEFTINQSEVLVNGSFVGVDEYAFNLRKNSPPAQKFIVMSNRGKECSYNIRLD